MNSYVSTTTLWSPSKIVFNNTKGQKFDRDVGTWEIDSITIRRGRYIFTRKGNTLTAIKAHAKEASSELHSLLACPDGIAYISTLQAGRGQELMATSGRALLRVDRLLNKHGKAIGFRAIMEND